MPPAGEMPGLTLPVIQASLAAPKEPARQGLLKGGSRNDTVNCSRLPFLLSSATNEDPGHGTPHFAAFRPIFGLKDDDQKIAARSEARSDISANR